MTNKLVWFGIVVVIASVGLSILFGGSSTVTTVKEQLVGASPSAGVWEQANGIFEEKRFNTASSTLCSFTAPTATSTLVFAGATFNEATTVNMYADWGKGAFETTATTTLFNATSVIEANDNEASDYPGYAVVFASTTEAAVNGALFAPREVLNLNVTSKNVDTTDTESFQLSGSCKAIFVKMAP